MAKQISIVRCSKCKSKLFRWENFLTTSKITDFNPSITCCACSEGKQQNKTSSSTTASGNYAKTKKGIRKDIHPTYCFKSATEANFARILTYCGAIWRYEERVFVFNGYKNKPHVYVMDFEVIGGPIGGIFPMGFYEVKGYMDASSRTKLRRLKKQYPNEAKDTQIIIYRHSNKNDIKFCKENGYEQIRFYDELTKEFSHLIKGWE